MGIKQIGVTIIVAIIVVGTAAFFIFKQQTMVNQTAETTTIPTIEISPTAVPAVTWNDEAGFKFNYPEGILINKHPEDTVNYANLTLTDESGNGSITILMKDDTYKTLEKWLAADKTLAGGNSMDTLLGEKNGKKVLTDAGTTIGVLDSGVLVTLKKEATVSPLLESAWKSIVDSWEFVYPTPTVGKTKTAASTDSSGDVLEEE